MTITVLAVLFMLLMLALTYVGYRFVIRRGVSRHEAHIGQCNLCRREFDLTRLIERPSGDSRIYRFCERCIRSLSEELLRRN